MFMGRKLTLSLVLCLTGFMTGSAQSVEPIVSKTAVHSKEVSKAPLPARGVIRLNPSNKYNVAPKDVYANIKRYHQCVRRVLPNYPQMW